MNSSVLISISLALVLLTLHLRDGRRVARRLDALAGQQRELETSLNRFMEEFEKIALQFSRLGPAKQTTLSPDEEPEAPDLFQYRPDAEGLVAVAAAGKGVEKRHLVLGLAQKGRSVSQIAGRLMIPSGEVTLILNLRQEKERVSATDGTRQKPVGRTRKSG